MGQVVRILAVILAVISFLAGCSQQHNPLTPAVVFATYTPVPTSTPAPTAIPYTGMSVRYYVGYFGPCMGGMYTFEKTGNSYTRYNYCQYSGVTTTATITAAEFAAQVFSADFKAKPGVAEIPVPTYVPANVTPANYKCYKLQENGSETTVCEDSNGVVTYEYYSAPPGTYDANYSEYLQEYYTN